MTADPNCIFCKIVNGELPSSRLYDNDQAIAIMDINPWTTGHCLVISKEHAVSFFELSEQSAVGIIQAAHRIAPAVRDAVQADGMNLIQSNGRAAWQQVDHFHLHLVPRWFSDPLTPPIVPGPGDLGAIEQTAQKIRQALA